MISIDMGGGKSSCVISEDISPTLTCTHYGEPVVCYEDKKLHPEDQGGALNETVMARKPEKEL